MKDNNNFLGDSNLDFVVLGEPKTEKQLFKEFPFEFNGKEDFVRFYLAHNGIFFSDGAEVNEECEVECFYDIGNRLEEMWEATKKHSPEANEYAKTHFPFASDAAGNEYFIEFPSGCVKYISWEYGLPDGESLVAQNFKEFCSMIKTLIY